MGKLTEQQKIEIMHEAVKLYIGNGTSWEKSYKEMVTTVEKEMIATAENESNDNNMYPCHVSEKGLMLTVALGKYSEVLFFGCDSF